MEQIADETAAHKLLKHIFKDVDEEALNWVASAGHKPKYQFAFGVFMQTRSTVLKGERHRAFVKTFLDNAIARSNLEAKINDFVVKDDDHLKTLLQVRATSLFPDDKELVALRAKNEIRYSLTITADDAAELSRIAAQAPDEFVASHKQLRDVLLRTLTDSPELQKLFPPTDNVSVELQASRKRVIDLIGSAEEGPAPAANAR